MPEQEEEQVYTCEHCGKSFESKLAATAHENLQCDENETDTSESDTDSEVEDGAETDEADAVEGESEADAGRTTAAIGDRLESELSEVIGADGEPSADEVGQREAVLGRLKLVQKEGALPQLMLEIGDVEVPLYANFKLVRRDGSAVLQTTAPDQSGGTVGGIPFMTKADDLSEPVPENTEVSEATESNTVRFESFAEDTNMAEEVDEDGSETVADVESAEPDETVEAQDAEELRQRLHEDYAMEMEELESLDAGELERLIEQENKARSALMEEVEELGADMDAIDEDMSLEALRDMRDELQETAELRETLVEKYGAEKSEVQGLSLDELEQLKRAYEEREEIIDAIAAEFNIDRTSLETKDIDELRKLENQLMGIESERAEVLEEHGIDIDVPDMPDVDEDDIDTITAEETVDEEDAEDTDVDAEDGEEPEEEDDEETDADEDVEEAADPEDEDAEAEANDADSESDIADLKEDMDDTAAEDADDTDDEEAKAVERGQAIVDQMDVVDLKKDFVDTIEQDDESEEVVEETEEESGGRLSNILSVFKRSEASGGKSNIKQAALANLKTAEELNDYNEATLLVAHVLKQFLEIKLGIARELTYLELVEQVEQSTLETQYQEDIKEFYRRMHVQEYKGEAQVDFNTALELTETVIKELG